MKTPEATMRQRAREIIEEASKNCPYFAIHLREKIEACDEIIETLKKGTCSCLLCPFPKKNIGGGLADGFCGSCSYFYNGAIGRECGCILIKNKIITINQAIDGLRIFKDEMKKYLKEKQRRPGT